MAAEDKNENCSFFSPILLLLVSIRIWILNRDALCSEANLFMFWQWAKTNLNIMQVPVESIDKTQTILSSTKYANILNNKYPG